MPLYIEILDHELSANDSALSGGMDARILERWTSETTGETVRLVDAPAVQGTGRATARFARILFN